MGDAPKLVQQQLSAQENWYSFLSKIHYTDNMLQASMLQVT